ncbi:hypothetical protein PMAYCL1PPCAC_12057 [Pristionchus mayeri]|uniref:Uncharacterized protein n=1 Tax=Pristionchus mayeri TaxID=1317129 RepID=A0AAN4ZP56_9BILA|nr:hypothetical protein PMAYCL1PPCAC_12057 [Pristionchus mayeri]
MNSMYGGETPAGPSGVYGGTGGNEEGNGGEASGDAAYYQVTRGAEYGHHYAPGNGQYEVLSRAIINSDGSMQEPGSYYSLEPHRPIPIHPSSTLSAIPANGDMLNGLPKNEGGEELVEENGSERRVQRNSRSKSSSFDSEKPEMTERENLIKRKKADQARARYHRMSEEERKEYNLRRRLKQRGMDENGRPLPPTPRQLDRVQEANRRKAEAARAKYHQMSVEEKKEYNLRRTEAFRRKRREEEMLMMSPAMRISHESYEKAQAIINRNSRKASAARERYARMSIEERKEYNQRRAELKRKREQERMERKMLIEAEGIEGMRQLCDGSGVSREMEEYDESMVYSKDEDNERRDDDEMVEVEVDDDSMIRPSSGASTSAASLPLSSSLPRGESEERGRRGAEREGVIKRGRQSKAAQRIIRAVEEAEAHNLEYERRRSEYEDNWSIHGTSMGGVLMEDGGRGVYVDERNDHIEVGEDLHHLQTRSASAGVYEYAEHSMDDHYGEGPDMVQHEVEVPHSPHHRMHHVHLEGDIDVVHADDDDMREDWGSDPPMLLSSARPYQPRDKRLHMQVLMDQSGEGGEISSRIVEQRARRALRSRMRYANMSTEEKARHNAERAKQLREARRRDIELLRLADNEDVMRDEDMRKLVEAAQERRSRRAEQARHKYRRMTEEERRAYNAMRDAQRRSRRRDMEGLTDGEESERGEEIRRVRGGVRSSSGVSSMGRGGEGPSTASGGAHHHHLQRGAAVAPGDHYVYEMYEQEWTGHQ